MNKGSIICGVATALICSGLIWAVGGREDSGMAGWETLNVSMEQVIGTSNGEGVKDAAEGVKDAAKVSQNSPAVADELENKGNTVTAPSGANGEGNENNPPIEATNVTATAKPIIVEPAAQVATQDGKVNVNTASNAELMDLPGIGEKKAQAIIDYRSSVGTFHSLSDLGKVKGIGTKMLEKLKPLVVF